MAPGAFFVLAGLALGKLAHYQQVGYLQAGSFYVRGGKCNGGYVGKVAAAAEERFRSLTGYLAWTGKLGADQNSQISK